MKINQFISCVLSMIVLSMSCSAYGYQEEVGAVAFRAACFVPESSVVRKIYNDALWDLQLEGTYNLVDSWALWGNLAYSHTNGRSIGLKDKTEMQQIPLTFGVKKSFCFGYGISPYLGAGAGVIFLEFHDHSPYVRKHVDLTGLAVLAKSGVEVCLTECIYADVFVDYAWNFFEGFNSKRNIRTYHTQTGGLKAGMGIGYRF